MNKLNVKKGDTVVVISGKDKGKQGKILAAMPEDQRVIVQNVNMITAALSSKRMWVPSARCTPDTVRTTTALTTSFFFTAPPGVADLTEATITSPMLAFLTLEPPRTRMHIISFAPLLSATLSLV